MKKDKHTTLIESVNGKVVFTFILIVLSLAVVWIVNRIAFEKIEGVVKELSVPNEKLTLSRSVFKDVSNLTHLQRVEVLSGNSKPSDSYLKESKRIEQNIKSLQNLLSDDTLQVARIDSVSSLLHLHHKIFLDYLRLRFNIIQKKEFDHQLKALTEDVESKKLQVDTNVVTGNKKIKTISVFNIDSPQVQVQKKSWIRNFFHKSSHQIIVKPQKQVIVEEEFSTKTDTLAFVNHDSLLAAIGNSLKNIENGRVQRRNQLKWGEQELLQANEILIRQLLIILDDIEKEEIVKVQTKTNEMVLLATKTIMLTKVITIVFILTAFVLGLLILIDITRSRDYRKKLEMAKVEAEYHSVAKQRFLANMSHEIRTPLQSIIGYSEQMLLQHGSVSDSAKAIHQSSEHLLQIINEVLDYSRITSGKFSFDNKAFDIKATVEEVFFNLKLQAEKKSIEFFLDIRNMNEADIIKGDSFRLKQILYNVLGNAVKFTEKGSVKLSVQKIMVNGLAKFIFVIADTGIGMSADDLKNAFNKFEQAQNSSIKIKSGTGLGLSIAKELIEMQEGKIFVQSEEGKGSVFTIEISYVQDDHLPAATNIKVVKPIGFDGKVWMVDDDPLILNLCSIILEKYNVGYKRFDTAQALLNETWDESVSIIFIDMRLPDMSGAELANKLRERNLENTHIIAFTAQVLSEDRNYILDKVFDTLLLKPFTEADFINVLNDVSNNDRYERDFDFSVLRKMIGDQAQMHTILKQCYTDTNDDIKELAHSVSNADLFSISLIIHRLAGRLAQVGEKKMATHLRKSEWMINENKNIEIAKKETTELLIQLDLFLEDLKRQIKLFS